MRPTVLLFDIDGTLVTTAGTGRRALGRAFAARFGRATALDGVRFDGMTDRAIVRAGLAAVGLPAAGPAAEAAIDGLLADYLALLDDEVRRSADLALHAGVLAALDAACGWDGVAVGLGTGNVRDGARIKLSRVGIYERFPFGGFGCDHEERAALLGIGATRGAARLGAAPGACRVVVIGDTPLDVAAARTIGAEAVGVGTSRFTPAELLAAGATAAFADLGAPGALAALRGAD
jgi:phosphoglycolate phosphatase-like HAD superfamily hydrolase